MMNSLFSSFDPTSSLKQMNWMMMTSTMIILPMNFWMKKSRWNTLKTNTTKFIKKEMLSNSKHKEIIMMACSLFMLIMINNLMGLFPYTFTPTSHMSISMTMALPMWMMMMMYSWINFTNKMFLHLLPQNTPSMIMPMMIVIETTGLIIRPISLSVRLMANMIAGHLLMTLLGDMNQNMFLLTTPLKMILMSFESSISIIQAYVFSTLITLYSSEIP
uniref:ATP synthase F0 subunit 6 n=1 Tax=Gergithus frontilongus TaxID=2733716 RepID=UPI002E79F3F3|nr:ATP synthase F0 subunit 6 [Gergithus frontilongus]WQB38508.1 ATP synthase F0 subunit 6 [Gergithus frontilongus]